MDAALMGMAARALAREARRQAAAAGNDTTATSILEAVIRDKWPLVSGSTGGQVISSTVNGRTVSMAIPTGMSHIEVMALAEMAIAVLHGQHRAKRIQTRFSCVSSPSSE